MHDFIAYDALSFQLLSILQPKNEFDKNLNAHCISMKSNHQFQIEKAFFFFVIIKQNANKCGRKIRPPINPGKNNREEKVVNQHTKKITVYNNKKIKKTITTPKHII